MYDGLAAHRGTRLLSGFLSLEIAHADPSVNSFYGVHTGLAMGSINRCGSDEQKGRRSGKGQAVTALAAEAPWSWAARQQYQAATVRYGRYGSPSRSSCFGVGVGTPQARP
jgi:hypothetical protein